MLAPAAKSRCRLLPHDQFFRASLDEIFLPDHVMGDPPHSDTITIHSRAKYDWWATVLNKKGQVGWTRDTDKFGNEDSCG